MAHYVGPCQECGVAVDRVIKPHRGRLCVACAIDVQRRHNFALGTGTHPDLEAYRQAGRVAGNQIRDRRGPAYDKWRQRIRAALED